MKLVLITGAFRSGTSLVAQIVHHLGYQVAPLIPAPAPPSWRSDWEDPFLTERLMRFEEVNWRDYFQFRRNMLDAWPMKRLGFAMKSPYLALHVNKIRPYFKTVVITVRRDVGREESLLRHPQLSIKDDAAIRTALEWIKPDVRLTYEEILAEPHLHVTELAHYLEQWDEDMIARAEALVGIPTEYPCLQSSPQ